MATLKPQTASRPAAKSNAPDLNSTPVEPPIIALGGSAGSPDPIAEFLSLLPADSGLAVIVVIHLSPDRESSLPAILQRRCRLRVVHPVHNQRIEPNHVYVIPPARTLTVMRGRLQLDRLKPQLGVRTAVDILFSSVATHCGERAAAIIFSGADTDGAAGFKRIKRRGGFALVQDTSEALHTEMPRAAIATGCAAGVLQVTEMPAYVLGHFGKPFPSDLTPVADAEPVLRTKTTPEEDAFIGRVLACVRERTGQDFNYYRRPAIMRRIERRMQLARVVQPSQYLTLLQKDSTEPDALLRDLLVSVTSFFRDPESFAAFSHCVPELFKGKRSEDFVRIWVPACATGEEAYSVAMLLSDFARTVSDAPRIQVFASDLDAAAIDVARSGIYPEKITASMSEETLRRFFTKEPRGFRVRRELRQLVLFTAHDAVKDPPFARMDAISCRNLMIYLSPQAKRDLLGVFHFALRESGLLFLGPSELLTAGDYFFRAVDRKHCIYRRSPSKSLRGAAYANVGALLRALHAENQAIRGAGAAFTSGAPKLDSVREGDTGPESPPAIELYLRLIERLAPASAVVDPKHRIVHLSQKMAAFLQLRNEKTLELPRVIHRALGQTLRMALDRASAKREPVVSPAILLKLDRKPSVVRMTVAPAEDLAPGHLLVLVEVLKPGAKRRAGCDFRPLVGELQRELEIMRTRLDETTEQAAASSAELNASNQELRAINQEMRSASEELEINRQELQSINEELSAVNQELSINLDGLARANADLHNLMNATAIPTVFLDEQLQIKRYTPSAAHLFNLIPSDVGREFAHLRHRLHYPRLLEDLRRVLATPGSVETEVCDDSDSWFLARVLPYRSPDKEGRISGVVLTLVDITERKRAEEALRRNEKRLRGQKEAFLAALNNATLEESLAVLARIVTEETAGKVRTAFYVADKDGARLHPIRGAGNMPTAGRLLGLLTGGGEIER